MFDTSAFTHGLAIGLALFVCPGPKDILILRQALFRHPAAELIAVGTFSDAVLIGVGMAGASAALSRMPALQSAALWLGVCLLVVHGFLSARRAFCYPLDVSAIAISGLTLTRGKSLAALLTVSFFNPVAWLDTVLVLGTMGAALPGKAQSAFALGAIVASLTWFLALVGAARWAGRWMTEPKAWRALEGCVATAMIGLAVYVAHGLF